MTDQVVPDDKDWTWTLARTCPECGHTAADVGPEDVAGLALDLTRPWAEVLRRPDVRDRPRPDVWSPLEYACHVRDVCRVFVGRLRLALEETDPQFPDWDQDRTAVQDRYAEQDPALVSSELGAAAGEISTAFAAVSGDQWRRGATRSNGSVFTVLTLGQYFLHDLAHHLVDVGAPRPLHPGTLT